MNEPPLWTINDACRYFEEAEMPIAAWRLRLMIRAISLKPAGETRSGPKGGRGEAMYDAGTLQRLHAKMMPFLAEHQPNG